MTKLAVLLSLLVAGCDTLASRDAAAGCQVADVISTYGALHYNPTASEQNPVPVNALALIKLALGAYIKWGDNDWERAPQGIRVFVTVLGCGAAISNVRVAGQH
jgi:hypothetical protein